MPAAPSRLFKRVYSRHLLLFLFAMCVYSAPACVFVSAAFAQEPVTTLDPAASIGTTETSPAGGASSVDPALSEERAKQIASRVPSVAGVLDSHSLLDRHASFDSERRVWTVSWTLPGNFRRLITVDVDDARGLVLKTEITAEAYLADIPVILEQEAIDIARSQPSVEEELAGREISDSASYGTDRIWTVSFNEGSNEVARVLVEDASGTVDEVMIGPQVLWQMARGYEGAFGRIVNEPYVWLPLCLLFLLPFINRRRPLSIVHLDLLVLLSFTISHYYFNQGKIDVSVPLAYPTLIYLFLRLGWLGFRRAKGRRQRAAMPHINFSSRVLLIALLVLVVFRLVINFADSNVVDVGYSGVIGADLIQEGRSPYGNMPSDNGNGDTYGPLNYLLYVPFERALPWSGNWDDLPSAHAAAIFFDLAAIAGMYVAGKRLMPGRRADGKRLGLALAFGWVAYPYTTFVQNCNVNDTIVAAFIIWGFALLSISPLAGLLLGFATQIKFFPAILAPLWSAFPRFWRGWGRRTLFVAGFVLAISVTLPVIFLGDGSFQTFWERSVEWQVHRDSPFSIWGQYPGKLATAQKLAQYFLVLLAVLSYFWPSRKTMGAVAASSAALIVGFEMVQTHWFYLYIPWFFPLALIAFLVKHPKTAVAAGERDAIIRNDA
jgi:hypothetical protein